MYHQYLHIHCRSCLDDLKLYKCFKSVNIMLLLFRSRSNKIQVQDYPHSWSATAYLMRWCGVYWWLSGVVWDLQSNCMMASHMLPLWWPPQDCGHDVSCLQQCCMASWKLGLLMQTSSSPLGALSWSHSPHTPAGSSLVFLLIGELEGPEMPAHHPLPLLKDDGGQHEVDYILPKRADRTLGGGKILLCGLFTKLYSLGQTVLRSAEDA